MKEREIELIRKRLKEAVIEGNAINNTTWATFFNISEEDLLNTVGIERGITNTLGA